MSASPTAPVHPRPILIAPAVSGQSTPTSAQHASASMPYTCVTCARRKVKCDKVAPVCSSCRKGRLECIYQEPAPRKRKRKPVDEVHERLDQYERLLKQNGLLPRDETSLISPADSGSHDQARAVPDLVGGDAAISIGTGKLLPSGRGKTRYVDSGIWRNLGEQDMHPSSDEEEDDDEAQPLSDLPTGRGDPLSAALLGAGAASPSLVDLHPTYDAAMKLWRLYVDNVDPVVKAVHVPTGLAMVQRAAANPSSASRPTEALLFAIYHFAVVSAIDGQCEALFAQPRHVLQSRYYEAARHALVNSHFLRTSDVAVLQAFVLFLLSVRTTYDPHTFWILTGVAVRLAQRLGIHRDGESLGLKPFDVQLRRCLFWQLLPLDGMAAQLSGTGISIPPESWDTKQPLNINDTDIWPDIIETPEPREGATDMIFCLARSELAKFNQRFHRNFGDWIKQCAVEDLEDTDQRLEELQDEMESRYIRYCDFSIPIHCLTMAMARAAISSAKFRSRISRAKTDKNVLTRQRDEMWQAANKCIDCYAAAHGNPLLAGFLWHLQAIFQWDPVVWVLNQTKTSPRVYGGPETWQKIVTVYTQHPELMSMKRALHVAVGRLALRAWDACQSCQTPGKEVFHNEPFFIFPLRSALNKKQENQPNVSAPESHTFDPLADVTDDLWPQNYPADGPNAASLDFAFNEDFSTDSMDWILFDRLISDQPNIPPT